MVHHRMDKDTQSNSVSEVSSVVKGRKKAITNTIFFNSYLFNDRVFVRDHFHVEQNYNLIEILPSCHSTIRL